MWMRTHMAGAHRLDHLPTRNQRRPPGKEVMLRGSEPAGVTIIAAAMVHTRSFRHGVCAIRPITLWVRFSDGARRDRTNSVAVRDRLASPCHRVGQGVTLTVMLPVYAPAAASWKLACVIWLVVVNVLF